MTAIDKATDYAAECMRAGKLVTEADLRERYGVNSPGACIRMAEDRTATPAPKPGPRKGKVDDRRLVDADRMDRAAAAIPRTRRQR